MESAVLTFDPLLPWTVLGPLFGVSALVASVGIVSGAHGAWLRLLAFLVIAVVLCNPSLVHEEREPVKDVAVIVVDQSSSQEMGERTDRSETALAALLDQLEGRDDLEVRVVRAGEGGSLSSAGETRLFDDIEAAYGDVPRQRRAGTILITDGQVHDLPENPETVAEYGPIHALLSGSRDEVDRRVEIVQAPSYGIVGRSVMVTVRVIDPSAPPGSMAEMVIGVDDQPHRLSRVPIGAPVDVEVPLTHGGENVVEVEVDAQDRELTNANNRTAAVVNAVRDRLRVLLVSGAPHSGERTWRSLLKADPSVDLVHFTILRPPEKQDGTPIRELSLIAFPIRELFEVKLDEFDLIIFDRYRQRGVLPQIYLDNIARYVLDGGALLESSGPSYSSPFSLFQSPLGAVLPAPPLGQVIERPFRPQVTDVGHRHPVTGGLPGANPGEDPSWGRWFRQNLVTADSGIVVMTGYADRPLLILDRVGEGRIAQLVSDHIWLWSRGFEGGGPQAELLRRLAHWLMKEPELEEEALRAHADGVTLTIERQTLTPRQRSVTVTAPDGSERSVELREQSGGRSVASVRVEEPGIYRVSDGVRTSLAVVGALSVPELTEVRTTEDRLKPVVEATGGGILWLGELSDGEGGVEVRRVQPNRAMAGDDWIGLRANGEFVVTGVTSIPLMPLVLVLVLALGTILGSWLREAK